LYSCYDVVRPDVVLELAWRNKIIDFAFPYLIQVVREYTGKVDQLFKELDKKKKEEEKKQEQPHSFHHPGGEELYMNTIPQIAYYPTDQMNLQHQQQQHILLQQQQQGGLGGLGGFGQSTLPPGFGGY